MGYLLGPGLCAPGRVPLSCREHLNVAVIHPNKPGLLFELEKKKERKRKWSLLTNWFHNSFIKPSSKPFILAPSGSIKSCMLKGRGEFGDAGNWRQAPVPPTLSSALPGGLQLEFRGRSCYFSWSDPRLQNQIISFVKSNKHWTPQTWFHYRNEWTPLYSTFHCHEIYVCIYM